MVLASYSIVGTSDEAPFENHLVSVFERDREGRIRRVVQTLGLGPTVVNGPSRPVNQMTGS